jgi:hypothetical protein
MSRLALPLAALLALFAGCAPPEQVEGVPMRPASYPETTSRVAFVLGERDLIPEGIAHDPVSGRFYLGSFRKSKIVEILPGGQARDLVPEHESGLQSVLGLRVDPGARRLWAASATTPYMSDHDPEATGFTGIYGFDLEGARPPFRRRRPMGSPLDAFNDMALDEAGNLYLSGFGNHRLYRLAGDRLEELMAFGEEDRPNGLDLSADGRHLFVSTGRDVVVVGVKEPTLHRLKIAEGESLAGIDGLYWHAGGLVAVQSKRGLGEAGYRIVRLVLDGERQRIAEVRVLEEDHPFWDQPTTGVIVRERKRDWLYYIANSQFSRFDERYALPPRAELSDVLVMKLRLDRRD